jgi:hypothetical protein
MVSSATVRDPVKDHLTAINAWEDEDFVRAVRAMQRDWQRKATVQGFPEFLFALEGH